MKKLDFELYTRPNGENEFLDFFNTLSFKEQNKLIQLIDVISEQGLQTAIKMKWVKKIEDNLYELRCKLGSNINRSFYFHVVHNTYVITHGFKKKTQKTPIKEIQKAKQIRDEYFKEQEDK